MEQDRENTAFDLYNNKEINYKNLSYSTIKNYLNEIGLKARLKITVPGLNEKNKIKRLEWA
jgi:hypothetical protein